RASTLQCVKHSSTSRRKFDCRVRQGQREPIGEIFAQIKRDWPRSQRRGGSRIWISRSAYTSPTNPTRKTKPVEPFGIVIGHTRRKHRRFPRRQWQLATIELLQNRLQSFRTFDAVFSICAVPSEKETIEILNRHRLNFRAQSVDREPANPRQQSAIAPFLFGCVGLKFPAEDA